MFWVGLGFGFLLGFIAADLAWRYVNRLGKQVKALREESDSWDAYINRLRD